MEPSEPAQATSATPPSTSSNPSPSPAPTTEAAAVPAPPPPAPAPQQQPPPSITVSPAPSQPSASPFPSLQHPINPTSQPAPQPQTVASPITPSPQAQQPQHRPPQPARALRPAQASFSSHLPPHAPSPTASAAGPSSPLPSLASSLPSSSGTLQRGGMAIGVPAALHHPRTQQQGPVPYSSFGPSATFGQTFNGLPRSSMGMLNQSAGAGLPVRQPVQAIQNVGIVGAHTAASMRPGAVPGNNQLRPGQQTLRSASPSPSNSLPQKFQGHGLIRGPPLSSPGSQLPSPSQSSQSVQQPWMSTPGRPTNPPSLSTPSYRPPNKPQGLQQRPHQPQQQQQSMPTALHQQQMPASQQQQKLLQQSQQQPHQKQQQQQLQQIQQQPSLQPQQQQQVSLPMQSLAKAQQSVQQQPQLSRPASQKALVPATLQQGATQPSPTSPTAGTDGGETGNRILSKRSIHELVMQVDPSEKLDPEVEDILVDIAEDFVESITTFGCSLAKHRKSTTLEAKDILLHLERNWNMTIPGFGGDEIKCYKKPFTNDIHKERLSLIKKSMVSTPDAAHAKNSATGAQANSKSHATRAPLIGSPKPT